MKINYISLILALVSLTSFAQSKNIWKSITDSEVTSQEKIRRNSTPKNFELFQLDLKSLKAKLQNAVDSVKNLI